MHATRASDLSDREEGHNEKFGCVREGGVCAHVYPMHQVVRRRSS
jgi:hypothetical protein